MSSTFTREKLQKRALVGCLQHREKEEGPDGQDGKTSLKP
ncbi:hypothetical protein GGP72_002210 [Salinibacter ruber]|uniref:Uncharacterized protein n=1 Tax=Salinibacter ruber TaxID=146919 RepID=A0A9X2Q0N8_9BACT|nr:hypothetical protein [Salinibacter ruber]MCS3678279.1 hypothetical protein [Salinibacter ruber]MCS3681566.1 hypothetical protein [Salinibacter ruber]